MTAMDYTPDGKTRELLSLVVGEFAFFSVMPKKHIFGSAPDEWGPRVREAVQCKERGEYFRGAEILTSLMLDSQTLYTELTDILFEIEACAGLVKIADQYLCHMIRKLDSAALTHLVPVYRSRLKAFAAAFESEEALRKHLSQLCGNPKYHLPMPYAQLKAHFEEISQSCTYAEFHEGLGATNESVTIVDHGDGAYMVAPTSRSVYLPDGKFDEMRSLVTSFIAEFDLDKGDMASRTELKISPEPYPQSWEDHVRRAVELKRRGQFLESARIYIDLSGDNGTVHTGVLDGLYKTIASAGDLVNASQVLYFSGRIYIEQGLFKNEALVANPDLLWAAVYGANFRDHRLRLEAAFGSREQLEGYLRSISGNPSYYLPRNYEIMATEFTEHLAATAPSQKPAQNRASGGCYVATAVYGSYDCPEVWVLRRFRDQTLAKSASGRAFIRSYYAASPIALRLLGRHGNRVFSWPLTSLVRALRAFGYSDEPYLD